MESGKWYEVGGRLMPQRGQQVDWKAPDGRTITGGTYQGVWVQPNGVYVYYMPTHWRPAADGRD